MIVTGAGFRDQGAADTLAADTSTLRTYGDLCAKAINQLAYRARVFDVPFTAEDVRAAVADMDEAAEPHHPNVLPAAFVKAARAGIIMQAGFTYATRPSRHSGMLRLWTAAR